MQLKGFHLISISHFPANPRPVAMSRRHTPASAPFTPDRVYQSNTSLESLEIRTPDSATGDSN